MQFVEPTQSALEPTTQTPSVSARAEIDTALCGGAVSASNGDHSMRNRAINGTDSGLCTVRVARDRTIGSNQSAFTELGAIRRAHTVCAGTQHRRRRSGTRAKSVQPCGAVQRLYH